MSKRWGRPCLEYLEGRDLLATLMWVAPSDAANKGWTAGTNWVDLANGARVAPMNADSVIFETGRTVNINGTDFTGTNTSSNQDIENLKLKDLTIERKYTGTLNLNETLKVTDTLAVRGGIIASVGGTYLKLEPAGAFTWGGGTLNADVTVSEAGKAKATVSLTGRGNRRIGADRTLSLHADTTWSSGDVLLGDGAKIINEAGSIFAVGGDFDGTIGYASPPGVIPGTPATPPAFTNKGTFTRTNGGGIARVAVNYTTEGTTSVTAGDVEFARTFTQTAGTTYTGGTGAFRLPRYPMVITGGTLNGTNTLFGGVINTGGTVAPGTVAAPGTLLIKGDYIQGAGGRLLARISAAGVVGLLDVQSDGKKGGRVSAGGTLEVDRNVGYTPAQGTTLDVLKAVRRQNAFGNVVINNNNWANGGMAGINFGSVPRGTGHQVMAKGPELLVQAPVGINVVANTTNPKVGEAVTYTVTVTTPPGAATPASAKLFAGDLFLGDVALSAAGPYLYVGYFVAVDLPAGQYPVAAVFDGTPTLAPASSPDLAMTVTPLSPLATSIALALDQAEAYPGEPVELKATVSAPGYAGGTVTFYDGETVLATVAVDVNGVAAISLLDLALGSHSLTAVYSGDAMFQGSLSSAVTLQASLHPDV